MEGFTENRETGLRPISINQYQATNIFQVLNESNSKSNITGEDADWQPIRIEGFTERGGKGFW